MSVEIPINITENESGLAVNMLGAPTLTDNGGGVGGKDTDNPYVLLNNGDGTARVVFVKGQNDWRISDSSNMANLEWAVIEENMDSCWISENASYDPNAEVVSTEATEEGEDGGDAVCQNIWWMERYRRMFSRSLTRSLRRWRRSGARMFLMIVPLR